MSQNTSQGRTGGRSLSLSQKLYGGFGAVIVLLVVAVGVSVWGSGSLASATHRITSGAEPDIVAGDQIRFAGDQLNTAQTQFLLDHGQSWPAYQQTAAAFEQALRNLNAAAAGSPKQEAIARKTAADFAAFQTDNAQIYAQIQAGSIAQAIAHANGAYSTALANTLVADGQQYVTNAHGESNADVANFNSSKSSALLIQLLIAVISVGLAAGLAFRITRGIKRAVAPVLDRLQMLQDRCATDLRRALEAMAGGDLTVEITPVTPPIEHIGGDELGQIAQAVNGIRERTVASVLAYNQTREALTGMIGQVAQTAGSVGSSSRQMAASSEETGKATGEIAHAVGDVAQGAERQVQMLEAVRQSAEDVARAVSESAQNAQHAAETVKHTRAIAQEGVDAAAQASAAMHSVSDSSVEASDAIRALASKSEQIGTIVQTITGIAEQTNLLALNAAIEAARAGEQGRGFAVVAEEVRKLAEESQRAAHEISGLIGAIQGETSKAVAVVQDGARRTQDGASVVEQTREAFERIESSVQDITGQIEQIAAASQQISASAGSMQQNIVDVAAVAQQSSASTEEVSASTEQTSASAQQIAASAHDLSGNAEELNRLVAQFTTRA